MYFRMSSPDSCAVEMPELVAVYCRFCKVFGGNVARELRPYIYQSPRLFELPFMFGFHIHEIGLNAASEVPIAAGASTPSTITSPKLARSRCDTSRARCHPGHGTARMWAGKRHTCARIVLVQRAISHANTRNMAHRVLQQASNQWISICCSLLKQKIA